MTDECEEILRDLSKEVKHIKGNLWGENGREGDITFIRRNVADLRKDHNTLSKMVWIIAGIIICSGSGLGVWCLL
jgi:hypothetical protein